jgi:hypothetical protein
LVFTNSVLITWIADTSIEALGDSSDVWMLLDTPSCSNLNPRPDYASATGSPRPTAADFSGQPTGITETADRLLAKPLDAPTSFQSLFKCQATHTIASDGKI